MSILEEICFGKFYFKVAMILRNSLLISSLLTNAEAWYNLSTSEVTELEKVDEDLLRKVLECPISTPKEMLYLELGVSPIRNIIRSRRLNYLQYILHEDKESLMYTFLEAQRENPVRNDWCQTIQEDLEVFGIDLTLEEIEKMSETQFKELVKQKEREASLAHLNNEKISKNHTKVMHIKHEALKMQDYLEPNSASIEECKFIFTLRSRMVDIRCNFRGNYNDGDTLCPVCYSGEDTQPHMLVCEDLLESHAVVLDIPEYEDLFGQNLKKKLEVALILKKHFKKRKQLLTQ